MRSKQWNVMKWNVYNWGFYQQQQEGGGNKFSAYVNFHL